MHLLSMDVKEVFIKSILQVIPVYSMQCFMFLVTFCWELESLFCKFWW